MKKCVAFFAVFLLVCALYASSVYNFGLGLSIGGQSNKVSTLSVDAVYIPFDRNYLNPSIRAEVTAGWNLKTVSWEGFKLSAGIELFRTFNNPFEFTISMKGPWAPQINTGVLFKEKAYAFVEISPFRVLDKDYQFEWFAPFFDFDENGIETWGILFFRYTPLYSIGSER